MLEKKYVNQDMNIELTSYIDNKQNVRFRGKDVALILGYSKPDNALKWHVSENYKMLHLMRPQCWYPKTGYQQNDTRGKWYTFIDEAGFYELVFSSKLPAAKEFRDWVFTIVLQSIRKYGQYKLFDNPHNHMIMIGNETDLHYKVVDLIRRLYHSCRSWRKSGYAGQKTGLV